MRRSILGILAPLGLVAAGLTLLLNTLGALPWNIWNEIGRWWPALVILSGLAILVRNLRA